MLRRREDGFTLVELVVTMTILMVVVGAILSALESGSRTERVASDRVDDEQTARLVLSQLDVDVRNATAVLSGTTAGTELDLQSGGNHVRWTVAGTTLARSLVDDTTSTVTAGVSDARLNSGLITLSTADGTDLSTVAGVTSRDLMHCTATVTATISIAARRPATPFSESATAALPSSLDHAGCP